MNWDSAKKRRSESDNRVPAQPKMTALIEGFSKLDNEPDRPVASLRRQPARRPVCAPV